MEDVYKECAIILKSYLSYDSLCVPVQFPIVYEIENFYGNVQYVYYYYICVRVPTLSNILLGKLSLSGLGYPNV